MSVEIVLFLIMVIVVAWYWWKNEKPVWKSVLFSVWTYAAFYLNAPNFLSISEGVQLKTPFFSIPFNMYESFGTPYIIISNVLLAAVGAYLGQNRNVKNEFSDRKIKEKFDSFILDSTEVKIIGRDLDFLLSEDYRGQREKISKLKNNAKLLCERTNDIKLIGLYHELLQDGIQVRSYCSRDGIANLKGQIKVDEHKKSAGIFVLKHPKPSRTFRGLKFIRKYFPFVEEFVLKRLDTTQMFQITEMESGYLLESVSQQFDRTFENSLHPVIRCIALDLGGVYLNGDLDIFYKFLDDTYGITMKKNKRDRLNINNDLMLGKITIREFILSNAPAKAKKKAHGLTADDWDNILNKWQCTWTPDEKIKKLLMDLNSLGYVIVPFSNLDRDNGDKYIREHYLPECCTHYYFSYEQEKSKPSKEAFEGFATFVKEKGYIHEVYQILLIDDQSENLDMASTLKWQTIRFYNNPSNENIDNLIEKLKHINILPKNYEI